MRAFLALPVIVGLAGCATSGTSTAPNYAAIVGMIQTNYPTLKAAAAVYEAQPGADPKVVAIIQKAEASADPLVASLSATSAPTTIKTVLADAGVLLAAPVPGISAQTKADITLALALLNSIVPAASAGI